MWKLSLEAQCFKLEMVPNAHLIKKFHNGSQMFKIIAII